MVYDEQPAPAPPKLPRNLVEKDAMRRLIIVLDKAALEIARLGSSSLTRGGGKISSSTGPVRYVLLNGEDHSGLIKKNGKDPAAYRPDITHQCLLSLLDSPLNKAGKLAIYIRTLKGVLIEVNPMTRIPRTYTRFAGLMVQLLHKLSVKSEGSSERLLHVIKNPLEDHLPVRVIRVAFSDKGPVVKVREWAHSLPSDKSVVIHIGAMSHGEDTFEGCPKENVISISQYPLSASVACGKACDAFEDVFAII